VRHRVVAVRFVDEEAARLAGAPRAVDHLVPHHLRVELTDHLLGGRVDEVVARPGLHRLHEVVGHRDGDVEVRDLRQVFLTGDELHDVRVIDAQDAHVGAASGASLLHRVRGRVIELHERDGSARHAGSGAHHRAVRTKPREREAGTAAALVDERHRTKRVVDAIPPVRQCVLDREHKAGGELSERATGVHERGRVRLEPALRHEAVELFGHFSNRTLARTVPTIRFSDDRGHPPKHVFGGLGRLATLVLHQIALFENRARVLAKSGGADGGLQG
jgi:hypothetical protein